MTSQPISTIYWGLVMMFNYKVFTMKKNNMNFVLASTLFVMCFALVGCSSSSPSSDYDETQTPGLSDPLENMNRKVFEFNQAVDDNIIYPVIDGYRYVVPSPARTGIHNVLSNLQSPVDLANQVLQGDVPGAARVGFRAIVNTFVGFGGAIDVAAIEGYEGESEDFGQTLAVWGVKHGPYMVVPLLGPSSVRDYSGYFVDSFMNPIRFYLFNIDEEHIYYSLLGARYADVRNELKDILEELESGSIDYYASVRSTYYQARESAVNDGGAVAFPDYDEE